MNHHVRAIASSAGDEPSNHDHYLYGWLKETKREASGRHERRSLAWEPETGEDELG